MLFNSLSFLFFLPVAFFIYWASPVKVRWIVLLAISYYSYLATSPKYVLLLFFTTLVIYGSARFVAASHTNTQKKAVLAATLLCVFGLLGFFKYYNFAIESATDFLNIFSIHLHPHTLKILMPAGISFYTFQSVSYLIDVYKGKIEPQKNFARLALYISFFPHIIMGPIGRTEPLMHQFFDEREFDGHKAVYGLRLMLWGYFKKLIIADSLAIYVDRIFGAVPYYFGMTFIMAAVMYTFQIYCDFSGYTDIAIGVAKLFNIDLMDNFKSPYLARSVREFWSRWHISLSTWFRDYVYIPLGGSRKGKIRKDLNQMITMLVSGLWHGSNWTFVIWGGLHGLYQVIEGFFRDLVKKPQDKKVMEMPAEDGKLTIKLAASNFIHWLITFILVSVAWVFFRADTISDAFFVVTHFHNGVVFHFANAWTKMMVDMSLTTFGLIKLFAALIFLMVYDFISLKHDIPQEISKIKAPVRWLLYVALTVVIIVSELHGGTSQQFVYFSF